MSTAPSPESDRGAASLEHATPLILVVDDQIGIIQSLYEILKVDYEVCMATSGAQALEFCDARLPDLILLDVVMPEMDGYEVCRRLKDNERTRQIPVVFVTAHADPAEEALALERGGADFISKPIHSQVVRARVRMLLALEQMSAQLRTLAMVDPLTGVANRRKFDEALQLEWRACARSSSPLSVIVIDIDFFKRFNDTYGHRAGDACLQAVSGVLRGIAQRPRDLIARCGGEEFVAILPDTALDTAHQKALEIADAVRSLAIPHSRSDAAPVVTISAGVATAVPDASSLPGDLVAQADRMLYAAKQAGRAQVRSGASTLREGAAGEFDAAPRPLRQEAESIVRAHAAGQRPMILVVDDTPSNIEVLADALSGEYEIVIATSGRAALEIADSARQPALILLDVMMPELDGYEVCHRLKANVRTRHIPVVFVTAIADPASEEQGFELGAVDYITKPFNIAVVRARVRTHLTVQGLQDDLEALNARLNARLTELTRAHAALHSSQEMQELYARAFESTADGVLITDAAGTIVAVNRSFTRITGYPADEAIGRNPRILKSGVHAAAFYDEMWTTIRECGHWTGEIFNRRKTGEVYPELRTISSVRDVHGAITHYVAVFSDISTLKDVQKQLDFLTWHDPLTGLANRHLFVAQLQNALDLFNRDSSYAAVILVGLDRFRLVNEAVGTAAADVALTRVAGRLQCVLHDGDTLARLSADNFGVALPALGTDRAAVAARALEIAEHLRTEISRPLTINGVDVHLTASAGIALLPDGADDSPGAALHRAETASHWCAAAGGNRTQFFEDEMGVAARRRFTLEQDLHAALARNGLRLYAQTQVDDDGKSTGAELLLRWAHPELGPIAPFEFIAIAEQTGLILGIEAWTLRQACALLASVQARGSGRHISLNISPRHFRQPLFVDEVVTALSDSGARGEGLILELTEGIIIHDAGDAATKMDALHKHGVRFSIDDFGVGYSSLAYLQKLPIHELKLDCSFMRKAPFDATSAAIVDVIIAIARHMKLRVVAEGVESAEHVAFLDARKPIGRQGFFYGDSIPCEQWLDDL